MFSLTVIDSPLEMPYSRSVIGSWINKSFNEFIVYNLQKKKKSIYTTSQRLGHTVSFSGLSFLLSFLLLFYYSFLHCRFKLRTSKLWGFTTHHKHKVVLVTWPKPNWDGKTSNIQLLENHSRWWPHEGFWLVVHALLFLSDFLWLRSIICSLTDLHALCCIVYAQLHRLQLHFP